MAERYMNNLTHNDYQVTGEFVTLNNERFYAIKNSDQMAPFFISVVSDSDHWLFISSNGGLTAGRVSPETALFPYETVDKIQDNALNTGSKTLIRVFDDAGNVVNWEPFNTEHNYRYQIKRNLYKNILGDKLCFEEHNIELNIVFRYTWATSDKYGFVRDCEIENLNDQTVELEFIDGLQNILPAGTPRYTQSQSSNLVDAYKWTEQEPTTGLALFTLFSGISDRAEPCESLRANTLFCLGLEDKKVMLSSAQLDNFRRGQSVETEAHKRGVRGSYLVNAKVSIAPNASQKWQIVANVEMTQEQSIALIEELNDTQTLFNNINDDIAAGSDELSRIMAATDGLQVTAEETVSVHHYANVLFNAMRGGIFDDQYSIDSADFAKNIKIFNSATYVRHQEFLTALPAKIALTDLLNQVVALNDPQLERLCREYMPISFGRRHGDPSRPWNQFVIKLKDENDNRLLTYQGNWRDIFQNWEAITFSYPEFIENVIAKFVNASTIDGYNPYRITKEGIDWEVEEPDDPWSYIGYWGDHQIIYLQKMLELSVKFHPERLSDLLYRPIFSYANVPYRIKPLSQILENAKSTVLFDEDLAAKIDKRVEELGADGKLVLADEQSVYQVNLLEKMVVALLSKLGNLVVGGGIWLNTQRPEWNDANNALVGQGLSMVTLCYLRRYVCFLLELLEEQTKAIELSSEVNIWLGRTAQTLAQIAIALKDGIDDKQCYDFTVALGQASSDYRQKVYQQEGFDGKVDIKVIDLSALLKDALEVIDHTITVNKREDNLYEAYNLLNYKEGSMKVDTLYQMLEGQVAVLSSGALGLDETINIVDSLFESDIYRENQDSFILYPDRKLPTFLQKNTIEAVGFNAIELLKQLEADNEATIVVKDVQGSYRFHSDFKNAEDLSTKLDQLADKYQAQLAKDKTAILDLYEQVFNHNAFTGRSGGMFGFEGLGSIYWHMVSKLLLAVEENYELALTSGNPEQIKRLGDLYYRVRHGIGFNKTPLEYGAFPTDPYSHTPGHAGAQQPGMTGQVKEEVLTRFAELGVKVEKGLVRFEPSLLRTQEFVAQPVAFDYLNIANEWQQLTVPAQGLAFTWCQVPIVYQLNDEVAPSINVTFANGRVETLTDLQLSATLSQQLFLRTGEIAQLHINVNSSQLYPSV